MIKKVREEVITYYVDESGAVIKTITESRLISETDEKERWESNSRTVPLM